MNAYFKYGDQGFSLIESLIALVILGVVMVASLDFFTNANVEFNRGHDDQLATVAADSAMELIKSATGCSAVLANPGSSVSLGALTGTLKVTWPATATADPCLATTTKTCAATPPTVVGTCVTWTEPGTTVNGNKIGLVTYVGA